MSNNLITSLPTIINEKVLDYGPNSNERIALQSEILALKSKMVERGSIINGKEILSGKKISMHPPHELAHTLGYFYKGNKELAEQAIDAALDAKMDWMNMDWKDRAAIFLKAADLIAGPYRYQVNASTMLCQSKNAYQSEIDAVAELVDFLRYNVKFLAEIFANQPGSSSGIWNRTEYRPLEGFVVAITPFNFTAIAGNLPATPALCGNTVVWKAAESQVYSAMLIMDIFKEAGLPDGVINLVHVDGPDFEDVVFNHKLFAGLHFTGSTGVFNHLWKTISNNVEKYVSYPRIVGETGGKDFIFVHPTGDPLQAAVGMIRGAYEFQGQKCSAASRAYVPVSLWAEIKSHMLHMLNEIKVGTVEDFSNFVNAVIDEKAFDKIAHYIEQVKDDKDCTILFGGNTDKSEGYFIEPTLILTKNPKSTTMCEEIFGPVLTLYVYEDDQVEPTLDLLDTTSVYALTGAIFAKERSVINHLTERLTYCAGNFYINDKPTGAVVGQQPFGGSRGSGTNDKAGSMLNLLRWLSPRTVKENFVTPTDYKYPFMG
ncbi:MAG TPA: L-glutamate gamma-semialdehyde dehydrogenase [Saprospiraceae bacterium]|nr:L-glutamate gamma-semialdehyde dehydrogenase [Saprospiraceae bacterium]